MRKENYVLSIEKAKEIIIDFLKDNFRQELVLSAESILNNCPIHFVDKKTINETKSNKDEIYDKELIGACATDEGIFFPKHLARYYPDEEFDEDNTLSIIIHEYAHKFRKLNSLYGYMFEEGFVTIFAEACIAHYKIKKQMQEEKNITQPEIFINTSWKYKKAESQVISILYILNQRGIDIELLGEYILGDENVFKQKCNQIFGEKFSAYFDLANSDQDQYYNDYDFKEQNSEILLTDILKEYIVKNGLDLKKYSDRNNLLLYNRSSKTLAKGIVAAGESSFKEADKEEYKLFESIVRISLEDEQQEKDYRINRIKKIINEKYSFSGKSREEIYNTLENLCSDYIQRKYSDRKENIIFIEELKKTFTDIEEFTKKFIELRRFTISSSVFDGLNLENVSFLDITKCVSEKLAYFTQKQIVERIRTIFEKCLGKEDLISKINELKTYEQNIDINEILPNYSDFQKFVIEMQEYIPEKFTNEQERNYQTLYNEMLNLYISRQEQQLLQDKEKAKEYQASIEYVSKQYKVVTNEESFNKVNELDNKLSDSLLINQEELEKENNNKSQEEEQKRNLENEKNTLSNKNAIVRFFKRKQIKRLAKQITELENSIQNSNLLLNQIEAEITELKNKIKTNEDELIELCGINLSDYKTILKQCKDEGLTAEELVEKKATLQSLLSNLNIKGKEQSLLALYEENGLTRQPIEEQLSEMKM